MSGLTWPDRSSQIQEDCKDKKWTVLPVCTRSNMLWESEGPMCDPSHLRHENGGCFVCSFRSVFPGQDPPASYYIATPPPPTKDDEVAAPASEKRKRKKPIPKSVKNAVWIMHVGESVATSTCFCCKVKTISQMTFHCGHVVAEANGGAVHVDNLRPICASCNGSMGTTNMDDFRARHFT